MRTTRRGAIIGGLVAASSLHPLSGCDRPARSGVTKLYVLGTIHSNHRDSDRYSLAVLEAAIREASPDIILTEIPPDRIDRALTSFRETGEIDEPRTQVFPEYTEIVFPLSRELGFEIMGAAGWTREIADNRRAALTAIQSDPNRRAEWQQHRAAQRGFAREIAGRGDDPRFIHTEEFDRAVEASRRPYARFFDADLGPGGWTQINAAHTRLINSALDSITGKGMTAIVTFGTAHKYKILQSVADRGDVQLIDSADLFA